MSAFANRSGKLLMEPSEDAGWIGGAAAPLEESSLRASARANWLWLVTFLNSRRALELAPVGSGLSGSIIGCFEEVLTGVPSEVLPYESSSFDCVVLHEADGLSPLSLEQMLAECRRVLTPGGWLYISRANPCGVLALRRSPVAWALTVVLELCAPRPRRGFGGRSAIGSAFAAGFTEVRRYFASPSLAVPRILIPDDRRAATALERVERQHSSQGALRVGIAAAGGYPVLHPVEVLLCRR